MMSQNEMDSLKDLYKYALGHYKCRSVDSVHVHDYIGNWGIDEPE